VGWAELLKIERPKLLPKGPQLPRWRGVPHAGGLVAKVGASATSVEGQTEHKKGQTATQLKEAVSSILVDHASTD